MNKSVSDWFHEQFRGWSIMHFALNGALVWVAGVVVSPLAGFTLWHVLFLCAGVLVAVLAVTSLWLRRDEGVRKSRGREQPGIREEVRQGYRVLAERARKIASLEEASELRGDLFARMEMHFSEAMIVPFRKLLDGIEHRTDFSKLLRECSVKLDAMIDSLHYSDIKRHPLG